MLLEEFVIAVEAEMGHSIRAVSPAEWRAITEVYHSPEADAVAVGPDRQRRFVASIVGVRDNRWAFVGPLGERVQALIDAYNEKATQLRRRAADLRAHADRLDDMAEIATF